MLQSPREEREGRVQMLLSLGNNGLDCLFKEVEVLECFNRSLARTGVWRGF